MFILFSRELSPVCLLGVGGRDGRYPLIEVDSSFPGMFSFVFTGSISLIMATGL